ncbi:MAG: GNAT family N-acetyltransferase [Actinomycetes bacterium]
MSGVRVDRLGPADAGRWKATRLRALLDSPAAFGSTHAREVAFTPDDWAERLSNPDGVCVLAALDGVDVGIGGGYVDLPGWLHVVAMWVAPEARGRRIGHRLLDEVRAWAAERALRVNLDVALGNDTARSSYLAYGFAPTGRTRPLREGATELVERLVLTDAR